MIEFISNVNEVLPYNRKQYLRRNKWFGLSFQLQGVFEGKDIGLSTFLDVYKPWLNNLINHFDDNTKLIINHDFIDEDWFPNKQRNLKKIRELFKKHNIPNSYKGAILVSKDVLSEHLEDFLSYPYTVLNKKGFYYNDIDISLNTRSLVIKISSHLTVDILSKELLLLQETTQNNYLDCFILKEYNGTPSVNILNPNLA